MAEQRKMVLVVDDEPALRDVLAYNLEREGYVVLQARDGEEGLRLARQRAPDAVLLDVTMPYLNGFDVCRALRQESGASILMLTARDEELDRVLGLELGADDYIVKPFSMRELLARVKAQLRRAERTPAGQVLRCGDLAITPERREVLRGSERLKLGPKEFDLLTLLAASPGRVFTREVLLERIWGSGYGGITTRTVDVHINLVRKKIEPDPARPRYIETVRGIGYRMAE